MGVLRAVSGNRFQFRLPADGAGGHILFFKHENGKHILVLADNYGSHEKFPKYETVPYFPPDTHDHRERDHLYEWHVVQNVQPGVYALNDYDFTAPRKNLRSVLNKPKNHALANMEIYDYPGEYTDPAMAAAIPRSGWRNCWPSTRSPVGGNAAGLAAGYLFSLEQLLARGSEPRISDRVRRASARIGRIRVLPGRRDFRQAASGEITAIEAKQQYRAARYP